ncbi:hypothetical protein [Roseibium alexandrii]|uniref:hypothetical protein n=1 Tax=Roseibium alexandrii TaxID=388408 RepID=UPI00375336D5
MQNAALACPMIPVAMHKKASNASEIGQKLMRCQKARVRVQVHAALENIRKLQNAAFGTLPANNKHKVDVGLTISRPLAGVQAKPPF